MSIKVNELIIRANILEKGINQKEHLMPNSDKKSNVDSTEIVQQCVDQVLEILKQKMER